MTVTTLWPCDQTFGFMSTVAVHRMDTNHTTEIFILFLERLNEQFKFSIYRITPNVREVINKDDIFYISSAAILWWLRPSATKQKRPLLYHSFKDTHDFISGLVFLCVIFWMYIFESVNNMLWLLLFCQLNELNSQPRLLYWTYLLIPPSPLPILLVLYLNLCGILRNEEQRRLWFMNKYSVELLPWIGELSYGL